MSDDDDADMSLPNGASNSCGCEEGKHVSCFGCKACYNLLLDNFRHHLLDNKNRKEKAYF